MMATTTIMMMMLTVVTLISVTILMMQKVLYKNVVPTLLDECRQNDSVLFALPTLINVIDFANKDDYCDNILTEFCALLVVPKPVQVRRRYCSGIVEALVGLGVPAAV